MPADNKTRNDIRYVVSAMRNHWKRWDEEVARVKAEHTLDRANFLHMVLESLSEDVYECSQFGRRLPEAPNEHIIYDMMMCRRDVAAETEKAIRNAMEQAAIDGDDPTEKGYDACFVATQQIMPVVFARIMLSKNERLYETANYLMAGWAATYLKPGERVINFLRGEGAAGALRERLYDELPGAVRAAYLDLSVQPEKRSQQLLECVRDNIGYPSKPKGEIEQRENPDGSPVDFNDPASLDPINLFLEMEEINQLIQQAGIREETNEWCVLQALLLNPYLAGYAGNIEIAAICGIKAGQVRVIRTRLKRKIEAAQKALQEATP